MPVYLHEGGGSTITGRAGMELYRLLTIRQGLLLEIRTEGRIRLTRGPKMTTRLRTEFGFKGNREAQLRQLDAYIATVRQGVAIVDNRTTTEE